MIKRLLVFVTGAVLVAAVPFSYAQVDSALLEPIASAFQNTLAVSSLHVEAQTMTTIEGGPQGMGGAQQGSASYDLALGQAGWNLSGSRTTSISFGEMQFESTVQTIVLDGVVYANLDGMGQMPMGGDGQAPPQGWFEVTADTAGENPMAGLVGDVEALASEALGGLQFPIDSTAITAIAELPTDTINDQPMRVYQITLDAAALIESIGADAVTPAGMGGGFGGGMPPMDGGFTPPADGQMPQIPEGTFTPPTEGEMPTLDPSTIQINIAVYIGESDGLVYRIYSVISSTNTVDAATVTTSTTSITDYSAFNTPITISAPTLGA
jgi:hypothetical protein